MNTGAGVVEVVGTGDRDIVPTWTRGLDHTIQESGERWVRIQVSSEYLVPKVSFERHDGGKWVPFAAYAPGDLPCLTCSVVESGSPPAACHCLPLVALHETEAAIRNDEGAVFSPNGWLYVTRWTSHDVIGIKAGFNNYVEVYDAMTGVRLGRRYYNFTGAYDEIEGLTLHPSGSIYVAVCDNDVWNDDEFEVHAFSHPDPSFPT
jgi:hypothetical protein